uniref:Reverse transcriptase domain-containing protein n=1 Tax=Tanacetum cinerariifolium TaxID=118510 RepID=A0A6L2NFA2_TANCI|nr:hypothetical protein [Tanacetum cinerariifolium]
MVETMEQYMSKTRADYGSGVARPKIEDKDNFELKAIQAQLNNLGREIKKVNEKVYVAQVGCEQGKGPHYTKDCPLKKKGKPSTKLTTRASVSVMSLLTYLNLRLGKLAHTKLTVELADMTVKYPKGIAKNVLVGIGKFVLWIDFIILDMPEDIKVPLILERPFLSTARAKIDFFKRKITLKVGEERIIFKSVKPASSSIKRVYMLSLRERMELDLEARLMGETLVRDQGDDLMPTIDEGELIEEFRARNDARMDSKVFGYLSDCNHDKKIRMDYAYNLKLYCMIDFEDMDTYRDEDMGDVFFGEPFLKEVRINARRFDGMITIYNGNETVTYQMARSYPRFIHHTNEQCSKISPLLKRIH